MKVLWLCNIVLPDYCEELGLKKTFVGGWMTGMLSQLENHDNLDIALCFPIIDSNRLKNGILNNHSYYTFQCNLYSHDYINYDQRMVTDFEKILNDYKPDIVHIWGTEYPHSSAMVEACEKFGLLDRVVVNIQGLVSVYAEHFYASIPEKYRTLVTEGYTSIENDRELFIKKGKLEIRLLKKVKHVIGRTDWDKACTTQINPEVNYHYCNEILRDEFYKHIGEWKSEMCERHSIFISQSMYPIKGLHFLLKAMPIILKLYPDTHIYSAGSNVAKAVDGFIKPYGIYINELINEYNLQDKITFLGPLNEIEMCEHYLKANVFVSPSVVENESNSISEAKILGTPVVASYVGGVTNRIISGYDGFLYQHDTSYMLAYYICEIFKDDELAQRLSINGSHGMSIINDRQTNVNQNYLIYDEIYHSQGDKHGLFDENF
jgi:glycosyltransferase involved in cell wall biosynthesis